MGNITELPYKDCEAYIVYYSQLHVFACANMIHLLTSSKWQFSIICILFVTWHFLYQSLRNKQQEWVTGK